jgi:cytochrome c oxidase cbb3-type subunit III
MSSFWSWYITIIALANIFAMWWLIKWTAKKRPNERPQTETTGHTWDENIAELNQPMPRWWLWLFYITIVFGLIYLALYPGLGRYPGLLNWSMETAYEAELADAEERYGPLFAAFAERDIAELASDTEAMATGRRLFGNNCAVCHGADGQGSPGFPNLRDGEWLYGGSADAIRHSILHGRSGVMPPMGSALGEQGVQEVAAFVYSLNGRSAPEHLVRAGQSRFAQMCAACHGVDGTGNHAIGAPNLTTRNWLYGGTLRAISESIRDGRQGAMPGQKELLGEDRVHLLAAYVYSLSRPAEASQ